jgi:hypothetical protein
MTSLARLVGSFAALLRPALGNEAGLKAWTDTARACDLPSTTPSPAAWNSTWRPSSPPSPCPSTMAGPRGREQQVQDDQAADVYGRAGFALLRHRILLG